MTTKYKVPDVYVNEISLFPPSVAEVETAIPAFIGYTEKAERNSPNDLHLKPTAISSLIEYETYFGYPRADEIKVEVTGSGGMFTSKVTEPSPLKFILYYCLKMFFDNRGGKCYIVSVGDYQGDILLNENQQKTRSGLLDGLNKVALEDEPTLLVIPEAVNLTYAEYKDLMQKMLDQCDDLKDRFAILDVFSGKEDKNYEIKITQNDKKSLFEANRSAWLNNLKYGAAYYPFLTTTLNYFLKEDGTNVVVTYPAPPVQAAVPAAPAPAPAAPAPAPAPAPAAAGTITKTLDQLKTEKTAIYNYVQTVLKDTYLVLPPSAAVAGVYAATDASRGVWKSPANVGLASVLAPKVKLNFQDQGDLNIDADSGKSINVIREFANKGTMVWGARTLSGNDNEWRYISVRRFFNMVEESVKKSTYWAVFEPNDANTWVRVRGMIKGYLELKWRDGAMAGATPGDAFFVKCGLGTTMTQLDILEGRMNVEIGIAVVRPAEFIILKFSHKMQTS